MHSSDPAGVPTFSRPSHLRSTLRMIASNALKIVARPDDFYVTMSQLDASYCRVAFTHRSYDRVTGDVSKLKYIIERCNRDEADVFIVTMTTRFVAGLLERPGDASVEAAVT